MREGSIQIDSKDRELADTDLLERQARFLLKKVNKAIREYQLIGDGDRIAVAVSGGKDSMSLLRLLLTYRVTQRREVDLIAVHIAVDGATGAQERARDLAAHCRDLGVEYVSEPLPMNEGESWPLSCWRCALNRRRALFLTCDRLGCNKVRIVPTRIRVVPAVLLNLIHHGCLEGIPAKRAFFGGKITVIRPLIFVPEKEIVLFARRAGYPIGHVECPNTENSERAYMTNLLRQIEERAPRVKVNLWRDVERKDSTKETTGDSGRDNQQFRGDDGEGADSGTAACCSSSGG